MQRCYKTRYGLKETVYFRLFGDCETFSSICPSEGPLFGVSLHGYLSGRRANVYVFTLLVSPACASVGPSVWQRIHLAAHRNCRSTLKEHIQRTYQLIERPFYL